MIFAAKTTASGLIALLIAFTFNLDQPQMGAADGFHRLTAAERTGPG